MIIKNVPYINDKGEKYAACQGIPTVMMVLKYFRPSLEMSFPELYKKLKYKRGTWFFEVYIVELLYSLGIPCKYYSNETPKKISDNEKEFERVSGLKLNEKNKKLLDAKHFDFCVDFVLSKKLFNKKEINIDFIIKQIQNGKLVIATVNRNKLIEQEGYKGHFILIRGFNKTCFVCNDAYLGENLKVHFDKFKKALYYSTDSYNEISKEESFHIVVIG